MEESESAGEKADLRRAATEGSSTGKRVGAVEEGGTKYSWPGGG